MQKKENCGPILEIEAVVHKVDPINRELAALIEEGLVTIDVPTGCEVILRGERVKLRMVQPGDRVRVTYAEPADHLVAHEIEVQPSSPSTSPSR
jgi:hypothetical protein